MNTDIDLFERFLFEAPEDDPPDMTDSTPPDIPDDMGSDDAPPDIDDGGDVGMDDAPPDMGEEESFTDDDGGFGDDMGDDEGDENSGDENSANMGLDDKISAVMNAKLYNQFLSLLSRITTQITSMNNNADVLFVISPDTLDTSKSLKQLDENIRDYLKHEFPNANYSKNLLFFNKCMNLLRLITDAFNKTIQKGIKEAK